MFALVARRELLLQLRDGRLRVALGLLLGVLIAACAAGWVQFERSMQEKGRFEDYARDQWLTQGERHPHRAAHYGMYVTMPEFGLAFFDPGLRPVAGQTLWLEAHARPAFANVPTQDDLTLSLGPTTVSGSAVLQLLGGLLALVMGAVAVSSDRESGVLRQILAQGCSIRNWLIGKTLGSAAILAIPLGAAGVVIIGGAVVISPESVRTDAALRALFLVVSNGLLLWVLLAVGVTLSSCLRSTRAALTAALAVWVGVFVLAPRAAAVLAEVAAPTPTLSAYRDAVLGAFNDGFDSRGGYAAQLAALETETVQRYGVESLADLPVGFSGIRMRHLDAWTAEVDDREYARLESTYASQQRVRMAIAAIAPYIAARAVSRGLAGTDWAHYRHFLTAAESYRRNLGGQMNALLEERLAGERWEIDGTDEDWATVSPLRYTSPSVGWALGQMATPLALLVAWATLVVGVCLTLAARRLRP